MSTTTLKPPAARLDQSEQTTAIALLTVLALAITYAYANTLMRAVNTWDDPRYSHGYLIPFFSAVLLWIRREPFVQPNMATRWWGVGMIGAAFLIRIAASYLAVLYIDMLTYLLCLAGAFVLVGGWSTMRWAGPPIGFLVFMFPLPTFSNAITGPLQRIATISSTYVLQCTGLGAYREGNRINLGDGDLQLGVVDACSGLRMLTIFVALAVAIALVTRRPLWQRIVLVASAVPIAVLVNVIRITVTGVLHLKVGKEVADAVFHDFAGWVMMPMALGFLYLELQILSRLMVEEEAPPSPVTLGAGYR